MAGQGGYKHRKVRLDRKRTQRVMKAKANIARIRAGFERRGVTWEPENNPTQMAALNHDARRWLSRDAFDKI